MHMAHIFTWFAFD